MIFSPSTVLVGFLLLFVQLLFALPWMSIAFLTRADWDSLRARPFQPWLVQRILAVLAVCLVGPYVFLSVVQDRSSLEITGRVWTALLQLQITVDLFILGFGLLLLVWPKGGAVALAAFREGIRQWPFWLLTILGAMLMFISIFVPYFTFGEDYLMVKQLGYDTIMLFAVLFGGLAASLSISEEIEGRTAITVMSKPVSRRQFMIGKYLGIIAAALFMFGLLGVAFEGVLFVKHWWDKLEPLSGPTQDPTLTPSQTYVGIIPTPVWVTSTLAAWNLPGSVTDILRGIGQWLAHTGDTLPGLILCYSQVMVLVGLSVALATRLPMVVNLPTVLVVFFLSHLTPVLLSIARRGQEESGGSAVSRLVGFVASLFDTILPNLSSFSMDPALLSDAPPDPVLFTQYVGAVTLYGLFYSGIVLLLGLILFEDRDLA